MKNNKVSFEELSSIIRNKFLLAGLLDRDSQLLGEYFSTVEFYGVESHGIKTIDAHIKRITSNSYNLSPCFKIENETPGFAIIDGDNSIGMVCADYCVDYAIKAVGKNGIFMVLSNNNNTFGSAFYYALKAAKKGYICIASSNSPAQMAPAGGKEKLFGTNPFSIAIPAKNNHPIVIDMATSVVAKSKINEYKLGQKPIPEGWALDSDGNPTTDAQTALSGLMLPMAGFKGYGLSMMIDILSGFLSGASCLNNVGRFYSDEKKTMDVGFSFLVLSPEMIYGKDFYERIDSYIETIRNSKQVDGNKIILPGDDRLEIFNKNMTQGYSLLTKL